MRLVTDLFAYCHAELPAWNTISISGYHIREAGATAVQEVAFTIANAIAYADAALAAGLAFDEFAPRLSFFFAAHDDLFEEVAKFRVARRAWARVALERFGSRDPRSTAMRFHVQTGGSTLTAQQPEVNAVRTTSRRWPRSSAARSRSTPTRSTRRSGCRRRRARGSPFAPSRCWPTRPGWRRPPTRSAAPTTWNG